MESGYYPPGTEYSPNAPWNQVDLPDEEIEVTVSVSLSKTVKVKVNDYKVNYIENEDVKCTSCDFSECNLHKAVEEQIVLPQNLAEFTSRMFEHDLNLKAAGMPRYLKEAVKDCSDWHVDELEIIKE